LQKVFDVQSVRSVSEELGVNRSIIHKWKRAALKNGNGTSSGKELAEIKAVMKRIKELEMENQILKNVWLRRRSQVSNESLCHQAGRMQQMYPASFCEGVVCLRALMEFAP
jgi:transposase-like protein